MDRHPLDGNAIASDRHYDDRDEEGGAIGDPCGRWNEPDEDCPKPWQCSGTMAETDGGFVACDLMIGNSIGWAKRLFPRIPSTPPRDGVE